MHINHATQTIVDISFFLFVCLGWWKEGVDRVHVGQPPLSWTKEIPELVWVEESQSLFILNGLLLHVTIIQPSVHFLAGSNLGVWRSLSTFMLPQVKCFLSLHYIVFTWLNYMVHTSQNLCSYNYMCIQVFSLGKRSMWKWRKQWG